MKTRESRMTLAKRKQLAKKLKTEWEFYQSQKNVTQAEFASRLGYTQSMLSQMINGHLEVPFHQAWQFSKVFKLDFESITQRYYR